MDFDLNAGIAILERTPATFRAMLAGLPPMWTDATEGPETWSPYVIIGHLIHAERTDWITRAEIILAQGPTAASRPTTASRSSATARGSRSPSSSTSSSACVPRTLRRSRRWKLTDAQLALEGEHPDSGRSRCGNTGHVGRA